MDISVILITIPVFFVFYQAIGLLTNKRRPRRGAWDAQHADAKPIDSLAEFISQRGPNRMYLQNKKFRETLENLLIRSGNPFGWSVESFLLYKEISVVLVVIFLWQADMQNPLELALGAFLGFKALNFYMGLKASTRMAEIQRHLPGYVDLLALTMESGLDLLAATERIIEKMKPNPLKSELQVLLQESKLGTSRKEALQHLSHRTNLSDIQSLTSLIIQSEELGTSLALVLRAYAEDMRNKRILRAEEMGGKAPVKLLFPMMVFFFPIVFIVIFGPLALSFLKGYK